MQNHKNSPEFKIVFNLSHCQGKRGSYPKTICSIFFTMLGTDVLNILNIKTQLLFYLQFFAKKQMSEKICLDLGLGK